MNQNDSAGARFRAAVADERPLQSSAPSTPMPREWRPHAASKRCICRAAASPPIRSGSDLGIQQHG